MLKDAEVLDNLDSDRKSNWRNVKKLLKCNWKKLIKLMLDSQRTLFTKIYYNLIYKLTLFKKIKLK